MTVPKLSEFDLGWVVGIVEGEGGIGLYSKGKRDGKLPRIAVGMTDQDTIRRLHAVVGAGYVLGPYQTTPDRKPYWRWAVENRDDVMDLLHEMRPHLSVRRQAQVDAVLAWDAARPRRYAYGVRGHLKWRSAA